MKAELELQLLKSRADGISIGGSIIYLPSTPIGALPIHNHEGDAQGGYLSGVFNSYHIDWPSGSTTMLTPANGARVYMHGAGTGPTSIYLATKRKDGSVHFHEALQGAGTPSAAAAKATQYWDTTNNQFWVNNNDSTGWTLIGPAYASVANANADLTLSTTYTDVSGLSITVPNAGTYVVSVSLMAEQDGGGVSLSARLLNDGAAETNIPTTARDTDAGGTGVSLITYTWLVTTSGANKVVKVQAKKGLATGTFKVYATYSTMVISGNGASAAATGGTIIVQEDDSTIDAAATTLDFTEPDATLVTSSPAGEANINMALYALLSGRSGGQQLLINSADANYWFGLPAGNPGVNLDANDWLEYVKASNILRMQIGAAVKLSIDGNGDLVVARYINTADISGGLVKPSSSDAQYIGATAGNPGVNWDANDWTDFVRASNLYRWLVGASVVFDIASDGTIHPRGNVTMDSGKTVDGVDVSALSGVDAQPANYGFLGPTSGGSAAPGFRAHVAADVAAHTDARHTGKIGEVPWGPLMITLKKALPAATNNATLDDDWVYKSPWTNEAVRINNWYIRFESNLAANATFELRKNGTAITGASITVTAGGRDAAFDAFTETTLADGDSLEVWQTAGNAENIGGSAYIYGDQDVVAAVTY